MIKKKFAATCSAVMLLISAKIIKNKNVSGYYAWKDDIENAGGKFVDKSCVVDENLITSPHYKYVGEWMKKLIEKIKLIYIFIKGLITFPLLKSLIA